jgi:DNA-binding NarL/FixJ family response regulator
MPPASFHNRTVLLVSDSAAVAQAMEHFIFSGLPMRVVARVHTFDNLDDAIRRFVPDVVIAYFNELDSERTQQIRDISLAAPDIHILVIAPTTSSRHVRDVFAAGARGYLLDMPSREDLLTALDRIREQRMVLDERLTETEEWR